MQNSLLDVFLACGITTLCLLILVAAFSPSARRKRALNGQAKEDYKVARGTQHLIILRHARDQLNQKARTLSSQISSSQAQVRQLEQRRDAILQQQLGLYIAENHLSEIPGIGPKFRGALLSLVDQVSTTFEMPRLTLEALERPARWKLISGSKNTNSRYQ